MLPLPHGKGNDLSLFYGEEWETGNSSQGPTEVMWLPALTAPEHGMGHCRICWLCLQQSEGGSDVQEDADLAELVAACRSLTQLLS